MPELKLYHIDQITQDVLKQEIGFSHLFHDLVDHVCCDVENNMKQGMSFEEAYKAVKMKIGFRGLKNIQEETLYMVDNKYRNMKKLMKISGIAGTTMLGFAAIFKIAHLPLAGSLLMLGALVLSFLFLPSALNVLWKETKNSKKLILFISAFIAGVAFILGMLFKIQHWPWSGILISFGMLTGIILFLPSLLIHLFQDKEKKHKRVLYISGVVSILIYSMGFWFRIMHWALAGSLILLGSLLLIFIVFPWFARIQWENETHVNGRFIFMVLAPLLFIMPGALVNLNLEHSYEEGFFIRLEKQDALIKLQNDNNKKLLTVYRDSLSYPEMAAIHSETDQIMGVISLIEHKMVDIAEGPDGQVNQANLDLSVSGGGNPIPYRTMNQPYNARPASLLLLPGCNARKTLENELAKYRDALNHHLGTDWTEQYEPLLKASEYLTNDSKPGIDLSLLPNLNSLLLLKSGLLIAESAALKQVTSKK